MNWILDPISYIKYLAGYAEGKTEQVKKEYEKKVNFVFWIVLASIIFLIYKQL